ncbi:MAG: dehydrogenase [Opitutae bacterium]|nr:dehydrogenase [Opitutae bacterium]|tara:strand:+ start:4463 stop:5431 length:969 start_codon:yes stop_codon:yes gene_type:complete
MIHPILFSFFASFLAVLVLHGQKQIRIGLIGLDTSHAVAFTKILNDPKNAQHVPGGKVVAAFKGGSRDIPSSWDRVDKYTEKLEADFGVKLYPSIEEMCKNVDAVLLESLDGRPHLKQAIPVIEAGLPMFIDKPVAGSVKDALAIFAMAKKRGVPVFTSSSLRFAKNTQAVRNGSIGKIKRCETFSPCAIEPHHPDLFWYGIHGVESLFTVMGPDCISVRRGLTEDGKIEVVGKWKGGRIGIYREGKGFGGKAVGEKGEAVVGAFDGYGPLLAEIIPFYKSGKPPVEMEESLAIYAFMEAADESKRRKGAEVTLAEILEKSK